MGYPPHLTDQMISELRDEVEAQKKKIESLELVATYAKDILEFWPQFSFRTVRTMVTKMENLKQALEMLK